MDAGVVIGTTQANSCVVPDAMLARHTLIFGSSGTGKTYFSYALVKEQLQKQKASLVVLDPKFETIQRMRGLCELVGMPPERVRVIDPKNPESAPGFNPFLVKGDASHTSATFLTLFEKMGGMVGDRMKQFITYAVPIAIWHDMRLVQIPRFLADAEFRKAILDRPLVHPRDEIYELSRIFFESGYTQGTKEAGRQESTSAIERQLNNFLGNRLFLRMFNAPRNTVDFDALFSTSQGPSAVLVNFGHEGTDMQESSGLFLAGILLESLRAAAARQPGPDPVVLMIDEVRKLSDFMADTLRDVVNMARERNIRLLIASQHPGQLPDGMREDVLVSSAVKAFFNPGYESSESAAKFLARIAPDPLSEDEEETEDEEDYSHIHPYSGKVLAEATNAPEGGLCAVKSDSRPTVLVADASHQSAIRSFMACASAFLPPLYLEDHRKLSDVARQLPEECVTLMWKEGFAYCRVEVPKPNMRRGEAKTIKPRATEYWNSELHGLDVGEAVVVLGRTPPCTVTVTRISPPSDASTAYVTANRTAQDAYAGTVMFTDYLRNLMGPIAPPPLSKTKEFAIDDRDTIE